MQVNFVPLVLGFCVALSHIDALPVRSSINEFELIADPKTSDTLEIRVISDDSPAETHEIKSFDTEISGDSKILTERNAVPEIIVDATGAAAGETETETGGGNPATAIASIPAQKRHWPIFLLSISMMQIVMLAVELGMNAHWTGSAIQTDPFNYMIGPSGETLIKLGGRFVPCMKPSVSETKYECSLGECTANQLCGITADGVPRQWWRLISPVMLHGGAVHLILNIFSQLIYGWELELHIKHWKTAIIYFLSAFFGFVLGGNYGSHRVSVGASGAVLGLLGGRFADSFLNWKSKKTPFLDFGINVFEILFTVLVGTFALPGVDNFSHIGGLIMGTLSGLTLIPAETPQYLGKKLRRILRSVAGLTAFTFQTAMILAFLLDTADKVCPGCKYLACVPTKTNHCTITR